MGIVSAEYWGQQRFGFGLDCLTESEAHYLLNTPHVDRIRNQIIAASEPELNHNVLLLQRRRTRQTVKKVFVRVGIEATMPKFTGS